MAEALYVTTKGNPEHPAVICLHGLLGSSRNLLRLTQEIANQGFFVISYDQRGHGHSPHYPSPSEDYSLAKMASDLIDIMDQHGITRAQVVGHSMGGRVSLAAAAAYPDRVISLSMLDVGIKLSRDAWDELNGIIAPLADSYETKQEAQSALAEHSPEMQQFLLSNLRTVDGRLTWIFDLAGARSMLNRTLNTNQLSDWEKVKCPILIARGGKSRHFRSEEVQFMLEKNQHAKSAEIPNAGHWVHVDNFADTARIVTEFLLANK